MWKIVLTTKTSFVLTIAKVVFSSSLSWNVPVLSSVLGKAELMINGEGLDVRCALLKDELLAE
jgi:hypothetical protein